MLTFLMISPFIIDYLKGISSKLSYLFFVHVKTLIYALIEEKVIYSFFYILKHWSILINIILNILIILLRGNKPSVLTVLTVTTS